jgi:hypothetical protein
VCAQEVSAGRPDHSVLGGDPVADGGHIRITLGRRRTWTGLQGRWLFSSKQCGYLLAQPGSWDCLQLSSGAFSGIDAGDKSHAASLMMMANRREFPSQPHEVPTPVCLAN